MPQPQPQPKSIKIPIRCNECGKRWSVTSTTLNDPECPKCGGVDWYVVEEK